jgi:PAS domain S-box-containing protein
VDAALDTAGAIVETVLDVVDVGIVLQDADGRALLSNPAARRILGLTADQLSGAAPIDARWTLLHEDGWPLPPEEHPARIAIRTRRPCRAASVGVKHPGGRVTWTSIEAHPLTRPGEPQPYAAAMAIADVTEALAARASDRRSHDRFRSLIEHSSDVVTIVDDRGRVTYESPSVEAVLGYAPGELVGPGRLARVHPEDLNAALTAVTGLIGRPGESVSCEYRIEARDGRWRVLESVATNRLHDPAVLGIVINTRDVTERRETEAALRATTSRLENLVQNLQAGVLVEDGARRIAVVNADMCRAFAIGVDPNALVGADCAAAARAAAPLMADPDRFVERIEEVIAAGVPVRGEEVAFADGRTFERDYIPIASGRLERSHLWIYRDISRRKEAEREAARLRDEAIRASRLKSEFLATMSHEIRTPMSGALLTLELLLDTALAPHQRDLAGIARDSAEGLLAVVNDALDLSKIEAERLAPRDAELDIAQVAEGVADVVLSEARRKGLVLTVFVDPAIPEQLRGDPQWLRQVLLNLAGNAVRFTERGAVEIRATLAASDPGAGAAAAATVRFAVTDTGIGIPADSRSRLFEPFVQLEPAAGGTGLGLAICERLVRLMGGEIEVESAPGAGSTFSFSLRLAEGGPPVPIQAGGRRVLILGPADHAGDYLEAVGAQVERVDSFEAAERAAAEARFDVALVGLDSPERAAALRASGAAAVVLVRDVDAPAGGFHAELTRPIKRARLYEAVLGTAPRAGGSGVLGAAPLPPGTRVLVAEDNEVNRELLVRQVEKAGASAAAVGSGRAAVDAMASGGFDAVLMDIHLPELDGPDAARAIRALGGPAGTTPIVAVTASGGPAERSACIEAGMDEVLVKPVSSGDLARALGRVLGGGGGGPGAPLDHGALDRLEADLGDRNELRRIAAIFLDQLERGTRAIVTAAGAGDGDEVRRAAHRLGSASATVGAVRVAHLCRQIEADPADAPRLAQTLREESDRAAAALGERLGQGSASSR